MIWVFAISAGFLALRLAVSLFNLVTWPLLPRTEEATNELISILVPARNEAEKLPRLMGSVLAQSFKNWELIVLDDQSTDDTSAVVKRFAARDNRIKLIQGKALPDGWLGKNWACHQLGATAKGDWFLFADADVVFYPSLLSSALKEASNKRLSLLSVFPSQEIHSPGERLVVPVMHWILLSLLLVRMVRWCRWTSFSAANGQFMLFKGDLYRKNKWHEVVRNSITEDIAIMTAVKRKRLRGETLLSNGLVSCRMYGGLGDGIQGFSKNLLAGFGNSIFGLMVFLWLVLFSWPLIMSALSWEYWLPCMIGIVLIRISESILAGENILLNIILHPFQMVTFVRVAFLSVYKKITKTNTWKGRNISL